LTKCVRPEFEEKEKVVKPPDREGETEPVWKIPFLIHSNF
jgi:hypothetical protein